MSLHYISIPNERMGEMRIFFFINRGGWEINQTDRKSVSGVVCGLLAGDRALELILDTIPEPCHTDHMVPPGNKQHSLCYFMFRQSSKYPYLVPQVVFSRRKTTFPMNPVAHYHRDTVATRSSHLGRFPPEEISVKGSRKLVCIPCACL